MWPFDAPYSISYRRSIVTDSLSPAVFEILGPKHIGVTTLTFQGQVTSSITWRFDSPYRVSYWCSIGTKFLPPSVFEIFGYKYNGVTTLTFWGHVTSLVMWPFDAHIAFPIGVPLSPTLSPAVFEILGPKYIGVTTLTFQGNVTSSITWRFDSTYGVSYWCSIGTKSLSPSVIEIFGSKVPVQCKSSLRMRDITRPVHPMQNLGTYLNFSPPHCLFIMTLLLGFDED